MISEVEALKIFQTTSLPEGRRLLSLKLAAAPKSERLAILREDDDEIKRQIAATIEIQRWYRGYRTRLGMSQLGQVVSNTAVYSGSRTLVNRLDDMRATVDIIPEQEGEELDVKSLYEAYRAALVQEGKEPADFETFLSSYEQHLDKENQEKKDVQILNVTPRKIRRREKPPTPEEGAMIIQRAWRRHIDIQVYRYYRDLINFRQRGDPQLMLKCINPKEAGFLDAAAGIHIKFRLAGERFPPNIYYKIFTHRNIVDMCANSPKDYTSAACKRRAMKDVHNKNNRKNLDDGSSWYERWENNGWRLVSDRLIQHVTVDPITWDTAKTKTKFHHDKLQRRQDVERKRRLKKIEWMKQMYREGMMKTRVTDKETIQLIEGAAAGMVAAVEEEGPDAVKEWEVDELLEWTTTLSFDEYIDSWKCIATSAKSEATIETRARLLSSYDGDPYMLSLTAHGSQRPNVHSVHQSYNTPSTGSGVIA